MFVPYEAMFKNPRGFQHKNHVREAQKRAAILNHLCSRHRATSRSCVESKVKPEVFGFTILMMCFGKHFSSRSCLENKVLAHVCVCIYIYIIYEGI